MGASSYRKPSPSFRRENKTSPMIEMLELLEEVERCRELVVEKQKELNDAKKELQKAEQKVTAQVGKLDPETKARLKRIMTGIDTPTPGE